MFIPTLNDELIENPLWHCSLPVQCFWQLAFKMELNKMTIRVAQIKQYAVQRTFCFFHQH